MFAFPSSKRIVCGTGTGADTSVYLCGRDSGPSPGNPLGKVKGEGEAPRRTRHQRSVRCSSHASATPMRINHLGTRCRALGPRPSRAH
jgi:hypothetical protein